MQVLKSLGVVFAVVCLSIAPAAAGQRGAHGQAPKTAPTPHQQPVHTTTHGNPHTAQPPTVHGNPHATTQPAPTSHGNPHVAAGTTTTGTTPTTTATTPTTAATATTTSTTTTNPIATKIGSHPRLESKVKALLPAGMTLATASSGFKNQGQFIAALHVSRNLNIPFSDLKSVMTAPHATSLGQAIQTLRPERAAVTEATRAEREAADDLSVTTTTSSTAPSTTTATTTATKKPKPHKTKTGQE